MRLSRFAIPVFLLLAAAFFRLHALTKNERLHPDEALFSTFARSAAVNGDWLLHGPLDKPPLTIYAEALSMMFIGVRPLPNGVLDLDIHVGEFAARLPAALGSIVLVAAIYRLSHDLYPHTKRRGDLAGRPANLTPILAMSLLALSPLAIAFSATVFTDGLMLLWLALALMMAARRRWGWSGVFLALGFASKQQALLYLPLILMIGWGESSKHHDPAFKSLARFALPLVLTVAILIVWDVLRAQPGGVWGLAAANNNPGRLIRANEIAPRLLKWLEYAQTLAGLSWLTALLSALGIAPLAARIAGEPRNRSSLVDVLLATYVLAYFLAHWLVALNTYDRYLLPVLPPILLLMARGVEWMEKFALRMESYRKVFTSLLIVLLFFCILALCFSALDASEGRINVGADLGEHTGIDDLAEFLNSRSLGAIVYDRWLGWELGYYMGQWSDKRRVYYPTPDEMVSGALQQPDPAPRYFPAPADEPLGPWLEALRSAGFAVTLVYDTPHFVVYALIPPDAGVSSAGSSWPGRSPSSGGVSGSPRGSDR